MKIQSTQDDRMKNYRPGCFFVRELQFHSYEKCA